MKWVGGVFRQTGPVPVQPPGAMLRWTPGELAAVKLYLQSLPPAAFSLDDWMLVVDYLVQKYLPQDVMMQEADWQAARASMMGRVQANLPAISAAAAMRLVERLPTDPALIERQFGMSAVQSSALRFGQKRCCQHVTHVSESLRRKLKLAVLDWQEDRFLGRPSALAQQSLESKLLDRFAEANRDWRRIALTEAGENANQGFIAALPEGAKVKRMEMYQGACAFCRAIDGKVFTVVAPDKPRKDGDTEVWVGKTNAERSSSPKKRTPEGPVARTRDALWWPAAGVMHPHCRGRWLRIAEPAMPVDPRFAAWLAGHYAQAERA